MLIVLVPGPEKVTAIDQKNRPFFAPNTV